MTSTDTNSGCSITGWLAAHVIGEEAPSYTFTIPDAQKDCTKLPPPCPGCYYASEFDAALLSYHSAGQDLTDYSASLLASSGNSSEVKTAGLISPANHEVVAIFAASGKEGSNDPAANDECGSACSFSAISGTPQLAPNASLVDSAYHSPYLIGQVWSGSSGGTFGAYSVTQLYNGAPDSGLNLSALVSIPAAPFLSSFKVSLVNNQVPNTTGENAVGGQISSMLVQALDQNKNVFSNYRGTIGFSSDDPHAVLPASYTFTAADAGRHTFAVTFKSVPLQDPAVRLTVTDGAAGVSAKDEPFLWFRGTFDVERWKDCDFVSCTVDPNGSYFCMTTCDIGTVHGLSSPTPFISIPGPKSTVCELPAEVVAQASAGGYSNPTPTSIEDCGPGSCSYSYWNTGQQPATGCISDALANQLAISNGCNTLGQPYGKATVYWRFQ